MANPVLLQAFDLLLTKSSADVVGVFDSSYNQVFSNARPMRAFVREASQLLRHPIETGQLITDNSIIMPVEIDYAIVVPPDFYRDTYQEVLQIYQNRELLTVQTRTNNYMNMVIAEMPHEETPDMYNALPMSIRLVQVIVVQSQSSFAPADPTQTNTQNVGQLNPYFIQSSTLPPIGVASTGNIADIPFYSSVPTPVTSGTSIPGAPGTPTFGDFGSTIPGNNSGTLTSQQTISAGFA